MAPGGSFAYQTSTKPTKPDPSQLLPTKANELFKNKITKNGNGFEWVLCGVAKLMNGNRKRFPPPFGRVDLIRFEIDWKFGGKSGEIQIREIPPPATRHPPPAARRPPPATYRPALKTANSIAVFQ